jgi:hypothetical protein
MHHRIMVLSERESIKRNCKVWGSQSPNPCNLKYPRIRKNRIPINRLEACSRTTKSAAPIRWISVRRGYRFTPRRRSKQTALSGNQIKKSRQGGRSRIDVQSPPTVTVPPSIMMTSASPPSVMMTSAAVMTPTVAVAASYLNKRTIGIGERIGVYPWHRGSRQDRGEH